MAHDMAAVATAAQHGVEDMAHDVATAATAAAGALRREASAVLMHVAGELPSHFVLYLNDETWEGEAGDRLAAEARAALQLKLPIVTIHEMCPQRGGCPFDKFFAVTPSDLVRDGIYNKIATTVYESPAHRQLGFLLFANSIGAIRGERTDCAITEAAMRSTAAATLMAGEMGLRCCDKIGSAISSRITQQSIGASSLQRGTDVKRHFRAVAKVISMKRDEAVAEVTDLTARCCDRVSSAVSQSCDRVSHAVSSTVPTAVAQQADKVANAVSNAVSSTVPIAVAQQATARRTSLKAVVKAVSLKRADKDECCTVQSTDKPGPSGTNELTPESTSVPTNAAKGGRLRLRSAFVAAGNLQTRV